MKRSHRKDRTLQPGMYPADDGGRGATSAVVIVVSLALIAGAVLCALAALGGLPF